MPKKIDVQFGTLFDLKAELYRKKGQQSANGHQKGPGGKPSLTVNTKKPFAKPVVKPDDLTATERRHKIKLLAADLAEEERKLQKSKEALAKKAALYDKLNSAQNGDPNAKSDEEDDDVPIDKRFLVNFDSKKSAAANDRGHSSDSDYSDDAETDKNVPYSEQFVEFTDSFGRSRRCMRKDLPGHLATDKQRHRDEDKDRHRPPSSNRDTEHVDGDDGQGQGQGCSSTLDAASYEQRMLAPRPRAYVNPNTVAKKDVFYQHVAHDDARELGAGYYQFDKDQEKRKEQMEELQRLRDQTANQREKVSSAQTSRKKLMTERLAKVMKRRKLGNFDLTSIVGQDEAEPEANSSSSVQASEIPLPGEPSNNIDTTTTALAKDNVNMTSADKTSTQTTREWDVGKKQIMLSQSAWVKQHRGERNSDFAPPSSYFK